MVTRWKKSRAIISFIAFAVGTSLLLSNGLSFGLMVSGRDGRQELKDAFQKDYQNTAVFRGCMSDYLENFIAMAVGGPVDGYHHVLYSGSGVYYDRDARDVQHSWNDWDDWNGWDGWDSWKDGSAVQEGTVTDPAYGGSAPNTEDSGSALNTGDDGSGPPKDADMAARREAMAQRVQKECEADKNVLYSISYDGQVKYTNAEGMNLSGKNEALPEGYNFLLTFDGKQVKIVKDGKELDVYGNGYYDEDSQWYVPGYANFTVDEKTQKAEICIAAAKAPMIYVKGNYAEDGSAQQSNRLYWLKKSVEKERREYLFSGMALLAGAALFACYVALRRDKRRADFFLAGITARIWFECKLLVVVLAAAVPLLAAVGSVQDLVYMIWAGHFALSDILDYTDAKGYIIMLFCLAYLLFNDFRYNEKPWKHNFYVFALSLIHRAGLKLPVQKRIVRGYAVILAAQITVACVMAVAAVFLGSYVYYYYVSYGTVVIMAAATLILMLVPGVLYVSHNKGLARDVGALAEQVEGIRSGNLKKPLLLPADTDLLEISENLNDIQRGMKEALEEQTKSERMKVELIANVSHDLKTPLTSIITYAELLKEEKGLPEHVRDYVQILSSKANRLRTMVLDVFEVSKAASGQLPVDLEALDFGKLLRQTLADMAETIKGSPVSLRTDIPEEPVMIVADGKRLYRVFQNLIQNALQYSLDGSRVYINLKADGRVAEASVKNTSQMEINGEVDFTERFVRGDQSRSDSGSGLGLSIAANFTEACGGTLTVAPIADLFVVKVEFEQIPRMQSDVSCLENAD